MSTSPDLTATLREWMHVVMARSMNDLGRFLKQADLTMAQYGTLMRLHHASRCGVGELANDLSITNAAASQLVDKLVNLGLVERTEDADDRRVKRLSLTDQGHAFVQQTFDARLGWTRALADSLPPERRAAIVAALRDLIAAADAMEPAPTGVGVTKTGVMRET